MIGEHDLDPRMCDQDVHDAFGLSYASYLVVPRVLLQEMPAAWQHGLTSLLEDFNARFPGHRDEYAVFKRDRETRRFAKDPLRNHRYPNEAAIDAARNDR